MLSVILKHLPARDRGNARLVSKQFYDASNVVSILETEELICSAVDDFQETLMNSQRRLFCLHFMEMELPGCDTKSFWETCGSKIVSLKLSHCDVSDEVGETILRCCFKLKHISFESTNGGFNSHTLLDQLIREKNICANLHSLEILHRSSLESETFPTGRIPRRMCNYTLYKLLAIFPNIRKFSYLMGIYREDQDHFHISDLSQSELENKHRLTFSSILSIVTSQAGVIETIKLLGCDKDENKCTFAFDHIAMVPNLTRLV